MAAKLQEAQEHITQAEKLCVCDKIDKNNFFKFFFSSLFIDFISIFNIIFSLKTSLLKWRPDFDSAADEYNKAGKK